MSNCNLRVSHNSAEPCAACTEPIHLFTTFKAEETASFCSLVASSLSRAACSQCKLQCECFSLANKLLIVTESLMSPVTWAVRERWLEYTVYYVYRQRGFRSFSSRSNTTMWKTHRLLQLKVLSAKCAEQSTCFIPHERHVTLFYCWYCCINKELLKLDAYIISLPYVSFNVN